MESYYKLRQAEANASGFLVMLCAVCATVIVLLALVFVPQSEAADIDKEVRVYGHGTSN